MFAELIIPIIFAGCFLKMWFDGKRDDEIIRRANEDREKNQARYSAQRQHRYLLNRDWNEAILEDEARRLGWNVVNRKLVRSN